jgi:hypothetical protein
MESKLNIGGTVDAFLIADIQGPIGDAWSM